MTESTFPQEWTIRASTSRFFPVHSTVCLTPKRSGSASFDLAVNWEDQATLTLLTADFPTGTPGTFRGKYDHPKGKPEPDQEKFEIVVTVCPGNEKGGPRFLCGQLHRRGSGGDPGGTGVWVAEEKPPKEPSPEE